MGLDIYFYKVKPRVGTDTNSVAALRHDLIEQSCAKFKKGIQKYVDAFENAVAKGDLASRKYAIIDIANYVKKANGGYDFYSEPFLREGVTDEKIRQLLEYHMEHHFPPEDVYFRKANFVYKFFQSYLVDEECVVTKPMILDLLSRCDKIIEAAKADGIIGANGKISRKYFYPNNFYILPDDKQKKVECSIRKANETMPTKWTDTARVLLPTTEGCFFGSTEYKIWYLEDILSSKQQFTKLLKYWKDDEVVYNVMSW